MGNHPTFVRCGFCNTTAPVKIQWRGSRNLDILIWLTFLLPGPLYTYWRWKGRRPICTHCGSENLTEIKRPTPSDEEKPLTAVKTEKEADDLGYEEHRF